MEKTSVTTVRYKVRYPKLDDHEQRLTKGAAYPNLYIGADSEGAQAVGIARSDLPLRKVRRVQDKPNAKITRLDARLDARDLRVHFALGKSDTMPG